MEELVGYIARSLVDDPTQVDIRQFQRGPTTIFELTVAKEDMGRVIGKNGRVATAMRTLLRVAAAHEGVKASLDIIDPE
ncbi:MAG TPA: RNA-binding protein [Chloroflexi bacterium]|nr:RNA-binding protein [Chloroflexota bacterium]